MSQIEGLLRSTLKISDSEILMPTELENIQLRQKAAEELQDKADEISNILDISPNAVLKSFNNTAYILDKDILVLVLDLKDKLYFIKIKSNDWKYVTDPVYH